MSNYIYRFPSFYSLTVTGLIIFIIAALIINNFKQILKLDFYKQIIMLSVIVIAVSNHGLLHALFEPTVKPSFMLFHF